MFNGDLDFFSGPTDNSWWYPTKNSKGSESFVCYKNKRIIRDER